MTMSEERSPPLLSSSSPSLLLLLLLPCARPKLLLEHRKGGREIIGRTAANK